MLDLKLLENMLDEALEKETQESLTEWLLSQRGSSFSVKEPKRHSWEKVINTQEQPRDFPYVVAA